MNLLKTSFYAAILAAAKASDPVDSEKHYGMPVGALLPGGPVPGRFDSRQDSRHRHRDHRWETTVHATVTVVEQALTSVTTMIPFVYTDLSILTTVQTVSGCPMTTVLVVSGTTTTTAVTTSTSFYTSTSTTSSLTATTTTVTSTGYTYTKPCHPTHRPCGCNRPRVRQHGEMPVVRREIEPVYSYDGEDDEDME